MRSQGKLDGPSRAASVDRPVPREHHVGRELCERLQRGDGGCLIVVEDPGTQLRAGCARGRVCGYEGIAGDQEAALRQVIGTVSAGVAGGRNGH